MIIFPLITIWMWFEVAIAVQSLSNNTLRKLVAGPTVFNREECVELCMDIIREENKSSLVSRATASRRRRKSARCWTTTDSAEPIGRFLTTSGPVT